MKETDKIIRGCKRGKVKEQEALFRKFADKMYGVCIYYSKNAAEAEDLLHDGFMKVFDNIRKYEDGNFEAWMRKVFVNLALMKFRREKRMTNVDDISYYQDKEDFIMENSDSQLNADEIMLLVADLPPQYKLVFNLYAIEGYKHSEIAEKLEISEGTSKSNLSRARDILKDKLSKRNLL